jgi:hypothetical protein
MSDETASLAILAVLVAFLVDDLVASARAIRHERRRLRIRGEL